jgi:transposase
LPENDPRWKQIEQKLPEHDHARVVEWQVDQLDRTIVDKLYHGLGNDAYDSIPLLKMVLYQYLKGRRSPATWEEEARINEAMQWLGRGYTPARSTGTSFVIASAR